VFPVIAALALAAASADVPRKPSHASPVRGSLQGLIRGDDYPPEALRTNAQGKVGILIRVGREGAVADCIVEQSSGSAILDARTCEIVRERGKFTAARDRHGRSVASEIRTGITWRIEDSQARSMTGSIAGLISSDDYPPQALDRNEQGTVGVLIQVDATGAVSGCTVEESSGFEVLDAQTCRLVQMRAKYRPATDAGGKPVASQARARITWRIGDDWVPTDPWSTRVILNFASRGQSPSCRYEVDGAMTPAPGEKPVGCPPEFEAAIPQIPAFGIGKALAVMETRFTPDGAWAPALPAGDVLVAREIVTLQINEAGKVTSCKITEQRGPVLPGSGCDEITQKTYRPRPGGDGKYAPFEATMTFSLYSHVEKLASASGIGGSPAN
jgi:TonB family protein